MKVKPQTYLHTFAFIVMGLGVARLTTDIEHFTWPWAAQGEKADTIHTDSLQSEILANTGKTADKADEAAKPSLGETVMPHNRILSVASYDKAFPDENDVQLSAAQKLGVTPVANRHEAEKRMNDLVYIGASPYYNVDRLRSSIPYLIPNAAVLLQDIGRAYYDSLTMKGVPLHKIIATSVLRTKEDVEKLRKRNPNATENSCHLYGTTFDIAQNRFITIEDPEGPHRRQVTNDTLKWVLSEVLRDMREQGRCYVKYEKKQGCFHISVR